MKEVVPNPNRETDRDRRESGREALQAEIARLNTLVKSLMHRMENLDSESGIVQSLAGSPHENTQPCQCEAQAIKLPADHALFIKSLAESEAYFRQLFERHSVVMLLIDALSLVIVDANLAAAQFYGYPLEKLRGMPLNCIQAQSEADIVIQRQQIIVGKRNKFVFDHRLANGVVRAVEAHISTVNYQGKTLFFSIIHDITERKQSEDLIRNLAFYDPLTQLPNRRLLDERLGRAIASCKRKGRYAALMMIDLDNFKSLNDTYGHGAGDLLLIDAAKRLKDSVRELDTVARFGGDEFVVVLDELGMDQAQSARYAEVIAEKIRHSLAQPYRLYLADSYGKDIVVEHRCTASIGVVIFGQHENRDESLKWADMAMYRAKDAGRNSIRIYEAS